MVETGLGLWDLRQGGEQVDLGETQEALETAWMWAMRCREGRVLLVVPSVLEKTFCREKGDKWTSLEN